MKTKIEVAQEFKEELRKLLYKYDADIIARYCKESKTVYMNVLIGTVWNAQGEITREWTEINLGDYIDNNSLLE